MIDFLFGWITRPRYLVSFMDAVMASVELIFLTLISLRLMIIYEKFWTKSRTYNISTRKWEKKCSSKK